VENRGAVPAASACEHARPRDKEVRRSSSHTHWPPRICVVGAHQYCTGNSRLIESVHDIVIPQHSWMPRIGSKVHASRLILGTWRETSTSSEAHQHWQWQEGPVCFIGPNLLVCIVWRPLQLLRGVICGEGFPGSWGGPGEVERGIQDCFSIPDHTNGWHDTR
jgi:hypothetical protein